MQANKSARPFKATFKTCGPLPRCETECKVCVETVKLLSAEAKGDQFGKSQK